MSKAATSIVARSNLEGSMGGGDPYRDAQGYHAAYVRRVAALARGDITISSVASNGSVTLDGEAMARAAENVALWSTYLSEECVRAMMEAGWHWST